MSHILWSLLPPSKGNKATAAALVAARGFSTKSTTDPPSPPSLSPTFHFQYLSSSSSSSSLFAYSAPLLNPLPSPTLESAGEGKLFRRRRRRRRRWRQLRERGRGRKAELSGGNCLETSQDWMRGEVGCSLGDGEASFFFSAINRSPFDAAEFASCEMGGRIPQYTSECREPRAVKRRIPRQSVYTSDVYYYIVRTYRTYNF